MNKSVLGIFCTPQDPKYNQFTIGQSCYLEYPFWRIVMCYRLFETILVVGGSFQFLTWTIMVYYLKIFQMPQRKPIGLLSCQPGKTSSCKHRACSPGTNSTKQAVACSAMQICLLHSVYTLSPASSQNPETKINVCL